MTYVQTPEQVAAANRYATYRNGWRDGAASRARSSMIAHHDDADLRAAYDRGFQDGQIAYGSAMLHAQQLYEHEPSVLRDTSARA